MQPMLVALPWMLVVSSRLLGGWSIVVILSLASRMCEMIVWGWAIFIGPSRQEFPLMS
jgi:hypothetical protein